MRKRLLDFMEHLQRQEFYYEDDEQWKFADGSAAALCTSSALLVAEQFGGAVLGYYSIDNPTAAIGLPDMEGHDFALLGNRWLVDYWAWRVTRSISSPIRDLNNRVELPIVHQLYGPESQWSLVHCFINVTPS